MLGRFNVTFNPRLLFLHNWWKTLAINLPDIPWIMRFSTQLGTGTILRPVWVPWRPFSNLFKWFFPWTWVVYSYTCIGQYSTEYLTGNILRPLFYSLCMSLLLTLCSVDSTLTFTDYQILTLISERLPVLVWFFLLVQ